MGRIKRALEKNKARKQNAPPLQSLPARQSAPDPDTTIILPHDDIIYSQTKTIQSSNNALSASAIGV